MVKSKAGFSGNCSLHLVQQGIMVAAVEHIFLFEIPERIGSRLRHGKKFGGFR